MICPF
jgi:hypothetical protein